MTDFSSTSAQSSGHQPNDELTLKEVIEMLLEYWRELWRKKWWIMLIALLIACFFGNKANKAVPVFNAKLTYLMNDNSSSSPLSGLLGSFGIGGEDKANLNRVIELSKSMNIIQKVMFSKIAIDSIGSKEDYIANHLIALNHYDELWSNETTDYRGFRFTSDNTDNFDRKELNVMKMLYGQIVGSPSIKDPIFTNTFEKSTGIMTVSAKTIDETLSIEMSKLIFEELRAFYLSNVTKGGQNTLVFTKEKTDSIYNKMQSKEYQLSRFNDSHRNVTDPDLLTKRRLIETELLKLKSMYAELTKNQELADFKLNAGMPEIMIIDAPIPPLALEAPSLIFELIKGTILGGFLAFTFFVGRKIVLDALKGDADLVMKCLYMSAFEPPIGLGDEIRALQQTFANLYGSAAALKPPVHITFSPPVHLDNEQLLIYKTNLRYVAAQTIPFEVELDSFDFFKKNRVVFIRVLANQALQEMYKTFQILIGNDLNQRYIPHFTIGYRKIEEDIFEKIIEDYTDQTFKARFKVSKLNLWKHENGSWKTIESMPFHIEQ